jgi:hypothetical protein
MEPAMAMMPPRQVACSGIVTVILAIEVGLVELGSR